MRLTKLKGCGVVNVPQKSNIDWERKISAPQLFVKQFLFPYWKRDVVCEEFLIPGSKLRLDLFNMSKGIVVEVSPDNYHKTYNNWLHKTRVSFSEKVKNDEQKLLWCNSNNIHFIELYDQDLDNLSHEYIKQKYGIHL